MASEHPNSMDDLVVELSRELSRIRTRGIHAIERNDSKQQPIEIPQIKSILMASPWAAEPLSLAVHKLLAHSIPYCSSPTARRALLAFYGIDASGPQPTGERQQRGLKALNVAPSASAESKKLHIREARIQLAHAIFLAAASDYQPPPNSDDDLDVEKLGIPPHTKALFDELRVLVQGRGVSPSKIDNDAPTLLRLPSVRDQYLRATGTESESDCAVEVLRCTSRSELMRGLHRGRLVADMLNLAQTTKQYDVRSEAYRQRAQLSVEEFAETEVRAFVKLATVLLGLERSPCQAEVERALGNKEHAELLYGLLGKVAATDREEVATHLVFLIEQNLHGIRRAVIEHPNGQTPTLTDWFVSMLEGVRREYEEWTKQYGGRIDAELEFLDFDLLSESLTIPVLYASREEVRTQREGVEVRYVDRRMETADDEQLESFLEGTIDVSQYLADTRRSSLVLLAQLIAYNEENDYWATAAGLNDEAGEVQTPAFPIVPILEFGDDRVTVDTNF